MNIVQRLERQRVLIVDDSPLAVKVLETLLREECEVFTATSGNMALQLARTVRPDLILLDIMMPDLNGYDVCRRLKQDEETRHVSVIFVTTLDREGDTARGLEVGAMDYIVKSYDPTLTMARIRNYLKLNRVEKANRQRNQQNQMILSAAGEGIYGVDGHGNITFINPAASKMLGWEIAELVGKPVHTQIHGRRADGTLNPEENCAICVAVRAGTVHRDNNDVFCRKDGACFPMEYVSTPILANDRVGEPPYVQGAVVVFRDIRQQKAMALRERNSQISRIAISALLETSLEPLSLPKQLHVALHIILSVSWLSIEYKGSIFLVDETANTLVMAAQLGLPDVLQARCARVSYGHCLCGRVAQTKQLLFSNKLDHQHDVHYAGIPEHGHYCVPILSHQRLLGVLNLYLPSSHLQNAEEDAFVVTIANTLAGIIERRKLEEQLEKTRKELDRLARHDTLTGLPNRMLFHERLHQGLVWARREQGMVALLFVDLDRFKCVNDMFGHEIGDQLLTLVAKEIQGLLREVDTVARMGGDEFTVILSGIAHVEDATLVAEKIIGRLQQPFSIQGNSCDIGASIGISIFPLHASDAEALILKSDAAMYCVKERGRNHFLLYQEGMENDWSDQSSTDVST